MCPSSHPIWIPRSASPHNVDVRPRPVLAAFTAGKVSLPRPRCGAGSAAAGQPALRGLHMDRTCAPAVTWQPSLNSPRGLGGDSREVFCSAKEGSQLMKGGVAASHFELVCSDDVVFGVHAPGRVEVVIVLTLHVRPDERRRMTRFRCGSLLLRGLGRALQIPKLGTNPGSSAVDTVAPVSLMGMAAIPKPCSYRGPSPIRGRPPLAPRRSPPEDRRSWSPGSSWDRLTPEGPWCRESKLCPRPWQCHHLRPPFREQRSRQPGS